MHTFYQEILSTIAARKPAVLGPAKFHLTFPEFDAICRCVCRSLASYPPCPAEFTAATCVRATRVPRRTPGSLLLLALQPFRVDFFCLFVLSSLDHQPDAAGVAGGLAASVSAATTHSRCGLLAACALHVAEGERAARSHAPLNPCTAGNRDLQLRGLVSRWAVLVPGTAASAVRATEDVNDDAVIEHRVRPLPGLSC
jgi:hypothetical protein